MLLAALSLAFSLIVAATTPTPAPVSKPTPAPVAAAPAAPSLPPTQPGISHDEGWFLFTTTDDGSRAIYFIAGNARHSIQANDLQLELQVNPLWPTRQASPDEVLAFPEGAPIGSAKSGLLGGAAPAPADTDQPAPAPADPAPASPAPAPATPTPAPAPQPAPADAAPAPAPATAPAPANPAPANPAPAAPIAQPVVADTAPAEPVIYTLRPGDNLTHIARDYGTSVEAILDANGVTNPNRIYAGQSLVIPIDDASPASADAPAPADAVAEDAAPAPVASNAGPDDTAASDSDTTQAATYTVQPGDSAFKIARRFGIDQNALLEANGISNPNRVYAGQVLTIPN